MIHAEPVKIVFEHEDLKYIYIYLSLHKRYQQINRIAAPFDLNFTWNTLELLVL